MANIKKANVPKIVRTCKTLLVAMSVIYVVGFVGFGVTGFPNGGISGIEWRVSFYRYVEGMLQALLYFGILYNLYHLIVKISQNAPFHSANPKRIRKVALLAFALAIVNIGANLAIGFSTHAFRVLHDSGLGKAFRNVLFGFGILIIAEVFEAGVRMKQDQDLTV
jgi:hypothetical protein